MQGLPYRDPLSNHQLKFLLTISLLWLSVRAGGAGLVLLRTKPSRQLKELELGNIQGGRF